MTPRMRLGWVAAIGFVAVFGLGELALWLLESARGAGWWAIDLELVVGAGKRLTAGDPLYADPAFLYPPAAAVVGVAVGAIDPVVRGLAYAALKVALVLLAVRALGASLPRTERALAAIGLLTCLPFLHDVMLGNANVLLAGSVALAAFGRPTPRSGIALGIVAAVFAKPLLVPIGLWLLVNRRGVLAGTFAGGILTTAAGLAVTGPGAYLDWLGALVAGGRFAVPFAGNHGVWAVFPDAWIPVAVVAAIALVLVLLTRGAQTGLVWATASGILIAPYAGTYSALPMAVALPVLLPAMPWLTLGLVALSPIATTYPLPVYAAVFLAAGLTLRESRRLQPAALASASAPPRGAAPGA